MSADPPALPRVDPEVEHSRESAARLLDAFARKLRLNWADSVERLRPARSPTVNDIAAGIQNFVRNQPAAALSIGVAAGFLAGRVLARRVLR
ncbi:MAG: hypothetical protein JO336_04260 [Acidobacteriia bacterium]|nr:hypothetical protein [Terriglobia bacterium]MBV8905344.1 hypothetical protein [Terriglobia bacterium]